MTAMTIEKLAELLKYGGAVGAGGISVLCKAEQ